MKKKNEELNYFNKTEELEVDNEGPLCWSKQYNDSIQEKKEKKKFVL